MKEIEKILNEIKDERDCGNVISGIKALDVESGIGEIAALFGLEKADDTYEEILSEEASSILAERLHQDMAYDAEIIAPEKARNLTERLMKLVDVKKARFYTNRRFGLSSWNPATDATFDNGILIVDNQTVTCIWFEDED